MLARCLGRVPRTAPAFVRQGSPGEWAQDTIEVELLAPNRVSKSSYMPEAKGWVGPAVTDRPFTAIQGIPLKNQTHLGASTPHSS